MSTRAHKSGAVEPTLLWIIFGLTFFCILALLLSLLDVRKRQRSVEPPPIYTGQKYEPEPDDDAAWEKLLPPAQSPEYIEARKKGKT